MQLVLHGFVKAPTRNQILFAGNVPHIDIVLLKKETVNILT